MVGDFGTLKDLAVSSDYDSISLELAKVNAGVVDRDSSIIFDQTNESTIANLRKAIGQLLKTKFLEKDEKLGVVLFVPSEPIDNTLLSPIEQTPIYIDVPGNTLRTTIHPDEFLQPDLDLTAYDDLVFYAASEDLLNPIPSPGDIVRVKLPKNFLNSSQVNPLDKKYLGTYIKRSTILATTNPIVTKEIAAGLQLSKEKLRDSLFQNKPRSVDQQDYIRLPFDGNFEVSSLPAPRIRPTTGLPQNHYALDIAMPVNTPVKAVCDQEIIFTGYQEKGAGYYIKARNSKYIFLYFHLNRDNPFNVKVGQLAKKGDVIGYSGNSGGSTGPHLHFEMKDLNNNKVNPLFFVQGSITVKDSIQEEFGLTNKTLQLPFPIEENTNTVDKVSVDTSSETQSVPQSTASNQSKSTQGTNKSPPINRPKMLLVDFLVDKATGVFTTSQIGSQSIKVREDIVKDLQKIKNTLNNYNISLTCNAQDVRINNDNLSLLGKVGLEIRLNKSAGLTSLNNLDIDDYFVGPDYNHPIGNGYKLVVYGNVKRNINYIDEKYKPEKKIIEVYDAKQLINNGPPKIKKIFKNVLNITKIFEDNGFVPVLPNQEFFLYSNLDKANWNIFQNTSKIVKGYSYKELLSTVYYDNGETAWRLPDLIWDGNKFI